MLRLFFLACVLPGVMSSCCLPRKYFAIRINDVTESRSSYVVDFDTQRIGITPQKHNFIKNIVNDFKNNISYTRFKDGSCKKRRVDKHFLYYRCMPTFAKLVSKDYLGPQSTRTETYRYDYQNVVEISFTVSKDKCYPIKRRQKSLTGNGEIKVISFKDVKELANTDRWLKRDFSDCVDDFGVIG